MSIDFANVHLVIVVSNANVHHTVLIFLPSTDQSDKSLVFSGRVWVIHYELHYDEHMAHKLIDLSHPNGRKVSNFVVMIN